MAMEYESLTSSKDKKSKEKDTDSAKSQLEAMAKAYKLKAKEADSMSRGLMRETFNAPTLEKLLLTKNTLAKKRFADGGEAKKKVKEQGLWGVKDYATETSAKMFPKQKGNDDQRDAARHMLAAAVVSRKLGPGMAEFLGKAHERLSSPASFFNMLGSGEPRYDYNVDVHNNKLGVDLGSRAKDQAELETMVEELAKKSVNKQEEGRPWTVSREQLKEIVAQNKKKMEKPPEYRAEGSPEEGEGYVKPSNPMAGKAATQARMRAEIAERARVASAREKLANTPVLDEAGGETTDEFIKRTTGLDAAMDEKRGTFLPMPVKRNGKTELIAPSILKDAMLPYNLSSQALTTGRFDPQKVPEAAMNVSLAGLATGKRPANSVGMAARPEGTSLYLGNKGEREGDYFNYPAETLRSGLNDIRYRNLEDVSGGETRKALMEAFWNNKARNYFVKQYGTESDPIYRAIANKTIKSPTFKKDFPEYILDQLSVGKTKTNAETGESRFFPKYPDASDAMRNRYDEMTTITGAVPVTNPRDVMDPTNKYSPSAEGNRLLEEIRNAEIDKMIAQGTPVNQVNPNLSFLTRSVSDPDNVVGPYSARSLLDSYERATGTALGRPELSSGVGDPDALAPNLIRAFETGETVYSAQSPNKVLKAMFNPEAINDFLMTVPERELKNIRFEDAVKGGVKLKTKQLERETLVEDIKAGRRVNEKFFSEGVSRPLLGYDEGPFEGFAWKRIEKPEATVAEGAYVGHSVGGYAEGGAYGPYSHQQFLDGKKQVYTLRDKRNRPVNTIEVRLGVNDLPEVTQIKGNGRASGNTAPESYDVAVLDFLQNYIKPVRIGEDDRFLTPILQSYKENLEQTAGQRETEALYRELAIDQPPQAPE
jgi:ribosomal protein L31E